MSHTSIRACGVSGVMLALLPVCTGQTIEDLANRSLEELLNVTVTSAARKPQSLKTTAAAVFVITSDDIRRSGIRVLPELLRLAPGVQVARLDGGNWAISIRGFSNDFSNKLLVLVDGRSIYNELYGGVFWDAEQMPVEDIDRIEVIRGPGAAMWGTNAVNGVINILTKSSADTLGGMMSGDMGSAEGPTAVVRYGDRIGSKATYRATALYTGQRRLASSGFILPNSGFHAARLSFRVDWAPTARDTVFASGSAYNASDGRVVFEPTLLDPLPPLRFGNETTYQGHFTVSWQRVFSEKSSTEVRFSAEHRDHNELLVPLDFKVSQLDFEHHWTPASRHDIVWGLTYRNSHYHISPTRTFNYLKLNWNLDVYTAFAADDITLVRDRLHLILGAQAGNNYFTGMEFQPTGRLLWTPASHLTTWAAASRAVRTPSIIDRANNAISLVFDLAPGLPGLFRTVGDPQYKSEPMISYELGQRVQIGKRFSVDGSAFLSSYQREGGYVAQIPQFIPPQNGNPGYVDFVSILQNARYGKVFGAEVSATWSAARRWKLLGGYSWLRERMHWFPGYVDFPAGKDPSQQFEIRSQLDLPRNFEFDAAAYFYGSTVPYGVGRYLRGDVRLGWRLAERLELNAGVRNALDPQHPEQFSVRYYQAFQVRRNIYGSFVWHF